MLHYTIGAWGRRVLTPRVPLPFLLLIRQRGYSPVGTLRIGRSSTCLSGTPPQPAELIPMADDGGPGPQRLPALPASNGCPLPGGFIIPGGSRRP